MIAMKPLSDLITLLSSTDPNVRRESVKTVCDLSRNNQNHESIVEAGGIRALICLLPDGDTMIRQTAAETMQHLAENSQNQEHIAKANGIGALVSLLSDWYTAIQQHAAAALCCLSENNYQNQDNIVRSGGIRSLVPLLSDRDTGLRKWAAMALWNLVSRDRNGERIVEAGGIRPLISLLSDGDSLIRQKASGILWRLSVNTKNQMGIADNGLRPLVSLLSDEDTITRKHAAGTIQGIAANNQNNKEHIAQAGGIKPLVSLLSEGDAAIRQHAAWAIHNLAEATQNQARIAAAGGIHPLISLLSDEDSSIRKNAAGALGNLALDHPQNKERIAQAGAIRPLVSLLSDRYTVVRHKAAEALSQIISHNGISFDATLIHDLKGCFEAETDHKIKNILAHIVDTCAVIQSKTINLETDASFAADTVEVYTHVSQTQQVQSLETLNSPTLLPQEAELPSPPASGVLSITKIDESRVKLGRLLGEGSFGKVYEADYNHQKVAVKKYLCAQIRRNELAGIYREILLMQQLDQKYLVRLLGIIETPATPPSLVMEYGAQGSLYAYLGGAENISWDWRLRTAEELARGLAYLHDKNIQHRDIKSLNVVLDEDLHAKWCDFGLSLLKEHATATQTHQAHTVGTTRWMAPELFDDEPPETKKSDIWSYGMVLFELATQSIPYKKLNNDQVIRRLIQHKPEAVPEECQARVPKFARLMESCWRAWGERPEASALLESLCDMRSEFRGEPTEHRNISEVTSDFIGLSMK